MKSLALVLSFLLGVFGWLMSPLWRLLKLAFYLFLLNAVVLGTAKGGEVVAGRRGDFKTCNFNDSKCTSGYTVASRFSYLSAPIAVAEYFAQTLLQGVKAP